MSRYDGLIIPRSYSEYLNKTDSATLSQMLQHLTGLWSHAVSAGDQKPVTSNAVNNALENYINKTDAATLQQALQLPGVLSGAVAAGDNKAVTSNAVNGALSDLEEYIALPYLSFDSISKVWTWRENNTYNTSKPLKTGQLVAIYLNNGLKGSFWYGDTTGVITLSVQNTNAAKSEKTNCIGVISGSYIDIII